MKAKDWIIGILLLTTNVIFLTTFLPQVGNSIPLLYLEFCAFMYLWVERSVVYLNQKIQNKEKTNDVISNLHEPDLKAGSDLADIEQGPSHAHKAEHRGSASDSVSQQTRLFYPKTQVSPNKVAARTNKAFFPTLRV